jgi:hypothetical protein
MAAENAAAMGRSVVPMKPHPNHAAEVPSIRVAAQAARAPNSRLSMHWKKIRKATESSATGTRRSQVFAEPQPEGRARHPIQQRRFFEPRRAPQAGCNPIAGAGHFAADGGVARLIRPEHAGRREAREVKDREQGNRQ